MPRAKAKPIVPGLTETQVLQQCLDVCLMLGLDIDRRNTGGAYLPGKGGKRQFVRFGTKGDADISGMVPGTGKKIDIEVKKPGQVPTADQMARIRRTCDQGGIGLWTDDPEWLLRVLQRWARTDARFEWPTVGQLVIRPGPTEE